MSSSSRFFLLLLFISLLQPSFPQTITVSSNFDHGSIDTLTQTSPDTLIGKPKHWIKADNIGDQYYWFYFRLDGVKDQQLTIKLTDLEGVYRGTPAYMYGAHVQPVLTYDHASWSRITNVAYDAASHVFTFTHQYTASPAWVAFTYPYHLARKDSVVAAAAAHTAARVETLGYSVENRPLEMLTITDQSVADAGKKVVVVISLQHPGEEPAGFVGEGMIGYLLSNDARAASIRRKFVYKIIPMMNPDGIFKGTSRYNWNSEDLNSEWDDDTSDKGNAPVEPEVATVKSWAANWLGAGKKIDLFIDIHSFGETFNRCAIPPGELPDLDKPFRTYWNVWRLDYLGTGTSTRCFYSQYNKQVVLFEITYWHIGNYQYLSISDYLGYGPAIVQGLDDYLYPGRISDPGQFINFPRDLRVINTPGEQQLKVVIPGLQGVHYPAITCTRVDGTNAYKLLAKTAETGGATFTWDYSSPQYSPGLYILSGVINQHFFTKKIIIVK